MFLCFINSYMKMIISPNFIFLLFVCGVFGVDADAVKSVSVMEGDSITLNTDLTEIHTYRRILWRFGSELIAQISEGSISYKDGPDARFRGRLQLDSKTASLTITNMRKKHSEIYKLEAVDKGEKGTTYKDFSVHVYESPPAIVVDRVEIESVSKKEGDSVTLQTDVTEPHGDELIVWRFGDKGKLIAKCDIEANSSQLSDYEIFRGRLKLDHQTGSLTISDLRNTDSGLHTVKISSSSKQTLYKRFSVAVSAPGLSSGAVAGIVVVVLLLCAAAAAAGVIYYQRKISELEGQKVKTVSEGASVTLNTDVTEVHRDDVIEWRFRDGGLPIAAIREGIPEIYDIGLDEKFLDRLKLDKKTGSLTIKKTRCTDTGLYELKISQDGKIKYKKFNVSVCVNTVSVFMLEGEPVTLKPDTEIQSDDVIEWRFGNEGPVIAEISGGNISIHNDAADGRFRFRLKLDETTGSLTITHTNVKQHAGVYQLQITSNRGDTDKKFKVDLEKRKISVREGKNLILNPETEIQKDDQILWRFEDILIAEIRGGTLKTHDDAADGRFRGRLKLDEKTGSLIITDMTTEHTGDYKLQIISSRGNKITRFVVTVYLRNITVEEGKNLTVKPKAEIQTNDQIQWRFEDKVILKAEIRGETVQTHDDAVADERFKGRLKLDEKTGSLTITNMRNEDSGEYKLQIISSRETTNKTFVVTVCGKPVLKSEGEPVTLNTNTEIQSDDLIQWRFGDRGLLIAKIERGIIFIYDDEANGKFRGRLELDEKTGSLTIKNTRTTDSGDYKLKKINSSGGVSYKAFRIYVRGEDNYSSESVNISVEEGKNRILNPETEIQKDDQIQWRFRGILIAEIRGGTLKTHDDAADGRFRDRLKLDEKTGSLTITDMITELTGEYKLQIISSRRNISKRFVVSVSGNRVNDTTIEMPPVNEEDLDEENEQEGMRLLVVR